MNTKSFFADNYVDLSDNDVDLSYNDFDLSDIVSTFQIMLLVSVLHIMGKNTLRFIFLTNE